MSRNKRKKKTIALSNAPQPRRNLRRTDSGEQNDRPPSGHSLVGSEVLEAVGSKGVVRRAMHDVIHSPDDESVAYRVGPEQEPSVVFRPDHQLADAGAEMAEDLGREFLISATTGADMSEIESASSSEPAEIGVSVREGPSDEEPGDEDDKAVDEDDEDEEDNLDTSEAPAIEPAPRQQAPRRRATE
jgi:hypothetical protein